MEKSQPSRSAAIIAAHRAFESDRPAEERICYDPFARKFLPPGFTVIGPHNIPEAEGLKLFQQVVPGFHEFFLARTRYMDDTLRDCLDSGLEQLVILGAGYDSRAYRFEALKTDVRIFEVDHPATQSVKKEKLREIFKAQPGHVTFVPADFRADCLDACLVSAGYNTGLKTLFIWEGVTMYLEEERVIDTLSFMAKNSGKDSCVVFDFTHPEVLDGTCGRTEAAEWLKITQKSEEPLRFGIARDRIPRFLESLGFMDVETVSGEYFNTHYFTGPNRGRESTPILAVARART